MTYRELEYTPYKIVLKIVETENYRLLTDDDTITDEELLTIWESIYTEFLSLNPSPEEERVLRIRREIYYLDAKFELIKVYCRILMFDYNEWVVDQLIGFGYKLTHDNYIDRIDFIRRECEGILVKAQNLRRQLPVEKEDVKVSVDEMLACYSAILEIDFDYNTVTATKVNALGKQIDIKLKSMQKITQDAK